MQIVADLEQGDIQRRPIPEMWSIAEYADHVREVLFAMRFALDSAVNDPGVNLGVVPEPEFTVEPRRIDMTTALAGINEEASALRARLLELKTREWGVTAIIGDDEVDVHWMARHTMPAITWVTSPTCETRPHGKLASVSCRPRQLPASPTET